jgi:hypothetical protein
VNVSTTPPQAWTAFGDDGPTAPSPDVAPEVADAAAEPVGAPPDTGPTDAPPGHAVPADPADVEDITDLDDDGEEESPPEATDILARLADVLGLGAGISTGAVRVDGQNATGHGAVAVGTINVTVPGGDGEDIWCQILPAAGVREMAASYATAPSDEQLDARLRRQHLVCLGGRPGTGRYTSACLALARRRSADRVGVLSVRRLSDLIRTEALRGGHGYLLRLDPEQPVDGLTWVALAARLRDLDANLVVLTDLDQPGPRLANELVEHRPASAAEVFRAHVRARLRGRCLDAGACGDGSCVAAYVDGELSTQPLLRTYLGGQPRPGEVVRLAESIARRTPRGSALAELLDQLLPEQMRRRAREILDPDGAEAPPMPGGADYLRAFRLSCAVLAGLPVSEIDRAARRLLGGPSAEVMGHPSGLRQPDLDVLLGNPLRQAVVVDGPVGGRRMRFAESAEKLPMYMLEAAWSGWGIPDRLLNWLADLACSTGPGVRQAAAGAIGWSAGHDVRAAIRVVGELARDRRPRVRQAAGIALVAMATQPALQRRIRVVVDGWLRSSAYHRDTVARAYALGLALLWPPRVAVAHLRSVAEQRMQRRGDAVVRGLLAIYQGGNPEVVVHALADWARSDSPEVRLHAARALQVLADRRAEPPRANWPELLELIRSGALRAADVAILWSVALQLPATAYRSWRTLGYWLSQADGDPELADRCLELLRLTMTNLPLRRRLAHQIRHVWRPIMHHSETLSRVSRLIVEG